MLILFVCIINIFHILFLKIYLTEEFDNYMQQDAHEFLNFLINHINEIILAERKTKNGSDSNSPPEPTWVHEIFQVCYMYYELIKKIKELF